MFQGLVIFYLVLVIAAPTNGLYPRKLDENTVPVVPSDTENNCGGCSSCKYPCNQVPPPSPPQPPSLPSPPPPPSHKKNPSSSSKYCPPPPPSSLIYINGPPGNLYPVNQYYSGASTSFSVGWRLLIGGGLLGLLALSKM